MLTLGRRGSSRGHKGEGHHGRPDDEVKTLNQEPFMKRIVVGGHDTTQPDHGVGHGRADSRWGAGVLNDSARPDECGCATSKFNPGSVG